MAKLISALGLCLLALFSGTAVSEELATSKPAYREVNVTSDSAPGWLPSIEQSETAEKTAHDYLAARDMGRIDDAYGFLADLNKQHLSLATYSAGTVEFNQKAGGVIERRIVKVTWTKDSPNAPLPGIYAALDTVSRFANIDRACGYLILYQPTSGDDFRVMREEENVLGNDVARSIEQKQGRAELDKLWAQLSQHCPNYPGAAAAP